MLDAIKSSLSGLQAASKQVNASASNIAGASVVGAVDPADGPSAYQPVDVVQTTNGTGGVSATTVNRDPASFTAFDPDSSFANAQGEVSVPNVDYTTEIVNLKLAEIAYKANLAVLRTTRELSQELLSRFDRKV